MQQMLMQAQKMQRELKKAKDELTKKEFIVSKGGMVKVTALGSKEIVEILIEEDAFEIENKELIDPHHKLGIKQQDETVAYQKRRADQG